MSQPRCLLTISTDCVHRSRQLQRDEEHKLPLQRIVKEAADSRRAEWQDFRHLLLIQPPQKAPDPLQGVINDEVHLKDPDENGNFQTLSRQQVDSRSSAAVRKFSHGRVKKYYARGPVTKWLTGRIWELATVHAQGRWDISIRTLNIRPMDAPIFRFCEDGNMTAVRDILATGRASILDCADRTEMTPLAVSRL